MAGTTEERLLTSREIIPDFRLLSIEVPTRQMPTPGQYTSTKPGLPEARWYVMSAWYQLNQEHIDRSLAAPTIFSSLPWYFLEAIKSPGTLVYYRHSENHLNGTVFFFYDTQSLCLLTNAAVRMGRYTSVQKPDNC